MSAVKSKALAAETPTVLIKPQRGLVGIDLRELWRFRELVFFLTWRDVLVRYKQTLLGGSWAILQPLLQMIIFNFIFGNVAGLSSGGIPRPLFTYAALLPWNLFANAVGDAGRSLVTNRNMITKVYFPRLIVPLADILGGLLDFAIAFLILIGMMFYYHTVPTANLWLLPVYILLSMATALGVGLWLSALNVHYRDVKYIIPFLTQFWMLITPIPYESKEIFSRLPAGLSWIFALNPMVGVIEGFRNALLGTPIYSTNLIWISILVALGLLVSGLIYFRSMERTFADVV
jgi:lipopolysaccharide transport system permease protein